MPQTPDIIFDTNVLSNFALSGQHSLLREMYPLTARCTGYVSSEVLGGLRAGHGGLRQLSESILNGWPPEEHCETSLERHMFANLATSLGDGESSCIALAASRGYLFACDDRLARREAERLGILLTGTVGILIKAVRTGGVELGKANEIMKTMINAGFYSPVAIITKEMVTG